MIGEFSRRSSGLSMAGPQPPRRPYGDDGIVLRQPNAPQGPQTPVPGEVSPGQPGGPRLLPISGGNAPTANAAIYRPGTNPPQLPAAPSSPPIAQPAGGGPLGGNPVGGPAPPPGMMYSTAGGGASPGGFGGVAQQIMDPTPYNKATARGGDLLRSIPASGRSLMGASPALSGLNAGRLNSQMGQMGRDLRGQSALEFSRQLGSEVPQTILGQLMGLRGLENDTLGLENKLLDNQLRGQLGQITPILQLLSQLMGGLF